MHVHVHVEMRPSKQNVTLPNYAPIVVNWSIPMKFADGGLGVPYRMHFMYQRSIPFTQMDYHEHEDEGYVLKVSMLIIIREYEN